MHVSMKPQPKINATENLFVRASNSFVQASRMHPFETWERSDPSS